MMPEIIIGTLPVAALGMAACISLLASAFFKSAKAVNLLSFALTLGAGGGSVGYLWLLSGKSVPGAMLSCDKLALFLDALLLTALLLIILLCWDYFDRKGAHRGEIYGLMMLSATGMVVLVSATNLITFYLGIELMSICFYILAGFLREHEGSVEAAMKYFLLGAFSSAFLLLGMAMLYGSSGTLDFMGLSATFSASLYQFGEPLALLGFFLFLVGLFFKLSLIPFHFWAPDVYQGSPTPVTALMAVGGKTAAAGAAIRLFLTAFSQAPLLSGKWFTLFCSVGLITVFVGSMIALTQRHVKRLLAYSSIVHAGFIAIGLAGLAMLPPIYAQSMLEAVLFYLAAYLFMNIGAFAVASVMEQPQNTDETLRSYSGLGITSPLLAGVFSLLMFSLAGIPLTAGFMGKFFVFKALVEGHQFAIAVWGFLAAVIATYYYLKVVVTLYFPHPGEDLATAPKVPAPTFAVLIISSLVTLYLGIFPGVITGIVAGIGIG